MPPGHTIIFVKSNKFNVAVVSVKLKRSSDSMHPLLNFTPPHGWADGKSGKGAL